jgi:16S rRNA (uracil1498-N3)-methyltransferase
MRCHIDPDSWSGPLLGPSPAESHYLTHVLRLRAGDRVEIFDGRGRVGEGRIADATRDAVQVEVIEQHSVARPIPAVVLLQAVPKGKRMEWVLEKAVELGVAEIRPLWTEHTVVKLDEPRAARRVKRWKDIMLSAARQCGTAWMPELLPPVTLPEQLRAAETFPACTLLCDLDPGSASIHDALSQAHAAGET